MSLFKCNHPFKRLAVYKDSTITPSDKYPKDFNHVTIHLFCQKCGTGSLERFGTNSGLTIKYAKSIRSTEEVVAEMVIEMKKSKD